ncbi:MAG: hypothetical protein FWD61_12360 [Phycisphaerales bacterium]|nr:hypothetical protein [Phycisphaerales bacterium]
MTTRYNQPDVDTDQDLSEAATKLAAASPYMAPPAGLRGRILQATAPQTFRMEDYRKAARETGRFYRWGFVAACAFLAAGAWYNMAIQKQLSLVKHNCDTVIADLINPRVDQVAIHQDNKLAARAYINDANKTAVVVIPQGALPADKTINQITLTRDGQKVAYTAIVVTAPRGDFPDAVSLVPSMNVQNLSPAPGKTVYTADFCH